MSRRRCERIHVGTSPLDRSFDRLIPDPFRHLSKLHWTPARVAVRAAALLCSTPTARVLDVGSGVGKLCTIGALGGRGHWVGVERHAALVEGSRTLARTLGVAGRTDFIHADAFAIPWTGFDAIYLYNPFETFSREEGSGVAIARVQRRLAKLAPCTRVVTLHGFGGAMPPSYELLYHERIPAFDVDLAVWLQRSRHRTSAS